MERISLCVLYFSGWCIFSFCVPHQYHYVSEPLNWTEAQTYCREKHADLALIDDSQDMKRFLKDFGKKSMFWIGQFSKIDWRWSDGYNKDGADYRNWGIPPVFDYDNNHFCAISGSTWSVDECLQTYPFICNNGTRQKPRFVFVNETVDWFSAQSYCREKHTDLATVRNDRENQEVQSPVPNGVQAWIGLFREPLFRFYYATGSSFIYWYTRSKHISLLTVECAAAASGRLKSVSCTKRLPFVCYSVPSPVMRRVVKLRVKPEDSSVDPNNPAVKADILKKLQDRLKERGVSGVTLKWREQPDGKVFYKEEKRSHGKKRNKTEL